MKQLIKDIKAHIWNNWADMDDKDFLTNIETLLDIVEKQSDALKFYAKTKRDTSFIGWQKEFKYRKAEKDSDYEYYPNHYEAIESLAETKSRLEGLK